MKKEMLMAALFICTTMSTALAAHWVPLQEGSDRVPSVMYDETSIQKSEDNLYFWEKIQRHDSSYEIRLAKVGLKNYDFADALMATKSPGQNMVFMHPQEWEEYGANAHPLRMSWLDRVLIKANEATKIGSNINLVSVEVPEDFSQED